MSGDHDRGRLLALLGRAALLARRLPVVPALDSRLHPAPARQVWMDGPGVVRDGQRELRRLARAAVGRPHLGGADGVSTRVFRVDPGSRARHEVATRRRHGLMYSTISPTLRNPSCSYNAFAAELSEATLNSTCLNSDRAQTS